MRHDELERYWKQIENFKKDLLQQVHLAILNDSIQDGFMSIEEKDNP